MSPASAGGGVYITCPIDEFNDLGFEFGDSVDDYMVTYKNYYGISGDSDPDKCAIIVSYELDPI